MTIPRLLPLLTVVALAAPCPARAQDEPDPATASRPGQGFIRNMKANFGDISPDDPLCKGEFGPGDKRKAQGLHTQIDANLGFAQGNAGRVKGADREHPAVVYHLARLDGFVACHKAIAARLEWLKTAGKEIKKRFFDFQGDTADYAATIKSLVYFAVDINDRVRKTRHPEQLQKWKDDLEAIHALCTGKYQGIQNDSRYGTSNERNPEMWCKTAALRDEILKRLVANQMAAAVGGATERFTQAAAELEQHEGYIRIDSVMEVKALNEPEAYKKEINAQHAGLLAVAGMEQDATLWKDFDAAHAALWAKIDQLAPTWKRPANKGGGPGAAAAKKRIKAMGSGTRPMAAYMTRESWQLIKNPLGIVIRRTKPGYLVYKDKGAATRWCKGRSFTYAEERVGAKYKRSNEVTELGFIRYEACK